MEGLRRFLPSAVMLLALLVPGSAGASAFGPDGGRSVATLSGNDAEECDGAVVPANLASGSTGDGQNISLDVLVLLDVHDAAKKVDVEATLAGAARIYAPLRITLAQTVKKMTLAPTTPATIEATDLIDLARTSVGGARPTAVDVVHILTTRELTSDDEPVVGYADCIGGVRYPTRSFSVSSIPVESSSVGPVNIYVDGTVETVAHEIGHLLGARHEHANCAEGTGAEDVGKTDPSACTLMSRFLELQSPDFGTLESLVVRGYAEDYATS